MTRTTLLLSTILLATGCVDVKTSLKQPRVELSQGKGVAVFSTGAAEPIYFGAVVLMKLYGVRRSGETSWSDTDVVLDRGYDKSHFSNEHGLVRIAVLDEGTYCFVPTASAGYVTTKAPVFGFRVRAGKVSYLGTIYRQPGAIRILQQNQTRDMDVALAAHPELADLPLERELATLGERCPSHL